MEAAGRQGHQMVLSNNKVVMQRVVFPVAGPSRRVHIVQQTTNRVN